MEAKWAPLEKALGPAQCAGFMFMGRMNGINLYKHGLARRYLNLSDDGRAFRWVGGGRFDQIRFEEALAWVEEPLKAMGETLETPYDESWKQQRAAALRAAGFELLQIQIQPDEVIVH